MTAYIQNLRASLRSDEQDGVRQKPDLEARVLEWFSAIPAISRYRPFSMVEIEVGVGAPGRQLGAALIKLGWQRRRKWTGSTQYSRFWLPPATSE